LSSKCCKLSKNCSFVSSVWSSVVACTLINVIVLYLPFSLHRRPLYS
jgi:hypothetical protein